MRREDQFLADILEAADATGRFLANTTKKEFLENELLQSAVLQKLIVIGEAAARLSRRFRMRHPDIEWDDVVGFRNIAVHAYFSINWAIVWNTAVRDVPFLQARVSQILEADSG